MDIGRAFSEYSPNGHNYIYQNGTYVCCNCGLENQVGYDGALLLEDLTGRIEADGAYLIGYLWNWDKGFEYMVTVSLVVEGLDEPIFLDCVPGDDGHILSIDAATVQKQVEALGYSLCTARLRVTILPIGYKDELDYSITLDPHLPVYHEDTTACGDKITYTACLFCGESSDIAYSSGACDMRVHSQENKVDENGREHTLTTYVCNTCGFSTLEDSYYYSDGCTSESYYCLYLKKLEDGSYAYSTTPDFSSSTKHSFKNYSFSYAEDTSLVRTATCSVCGASMDNLSVMLGLCDGVKAELDTGATSSTMYITLTASETTNVEFMLSKFVGTSATVRLTNAETQENVLSMSMKQGMGDTVSNQATLEAGVTYTLRISASVQQITAFALDLYPIK